MGLLAWIVVGLIAGWLAGMVMRGGGYGVLGDIIIGVVGAYCRRHDGYQPVFDPGRIRRGNRFARSGAISGWW
jgi:hypothetical protein